MGIGLTDSVTAIGKVGKAAAKWHIKKNQLQRHAIAHTELELEKDLDGDGVIGAVGCSARDRDRLRDDDTGRQPDTLGTPGDQTRPLPSEDRPRKARDPGRRSPRKPSKSGKSRKNRKSRKSRKRK